MALAKMQAASNPGVQTVMQSLELGGAGKTVSLSFTVPAEVFDALASIHDGVRRTKPRGRVAGMDALRAARVRNTGAMARRNRKLLRLSVQRFKSRRAQAPRSGIRSFSKRGS